MSEKRLMMKRIRSRDLDGRKKLWEVKIEIKGKKTEGKRGKAEDKQ